MVNEFEKEYKKLFVSVSKKIKEKIKEAEKAMEEAQKLSDEHGIPFSSPLSYFHSDTYIPESFAKVKEKFAEIKNVKSEGEEEFDEADDPGLAKLAKIVDLDELANHDRWGEAYLGWESDGWSHSSMFC